MLGNAAKNAHSDTTIEVSRKHALGMRHQKFQQLVLGIADVDFPVFHRDRAAYRIEHDCARFHQALRTFRDFPSQQRIDPGAEFARRERLGHIIVRALVQTGDLVFFHSLCRQHDNRQRPQLAALADARQQLQSALVRQHPVEQHQIRHLPQQQVPGVGCGRYGHRLAANRSNCE